VSIGDNVFHRSTRVVINTYRGSKADEYATENGIALQYLD